MVDRHEITEPARQPLRLDRRRLVGRGDARANYDLLMERPLGLRHQRDERLVEIGLAGLVEQLLQIARGDDLAVVHRHQPVEALGFVHIGGGDDDAHLRAAGANRVDQVPELAARQRIDAGCRLVENEEVRIVDQRAAEAELLLHAAGELAGRARLELFHRGRSQKLGDARASLIRALAEQTAEEVDVLEHAQRRIEIAAKPLWHIRDAAAYLLEVAIVGDVLVEHDDLADLDDLHAGDQPEQSRLSDAVRADDPDHDARRDVDRNVVERDGRAIPVRYALDPRDGLAGHLATGVWLSGDGAAGAAICGAEAAGAALSLGFGGGAWTLA